MVHLMITFMTRVILTQILTLPSSLLYIVTWGIYDHQHQDKLKEYFDYFFIASESLFNDNCNKHPLYH